MTDAPGPFTASALASGLVTAEQLDYALRLVKHRSGIDVGSVAESTLANIFVEQSMLTRYQADQLAAGRTKLTLGPYLVTDWIGQGGMGQVFKAVHQVMGRECAVKVLPLNRATPETLSGFNREIRMQAKLDCPYLVRAFDAGQDGNVHFLVTEYVPGMDLRRLVKSRRGPLPIHQAAGIILQAAMGLDYAHRQGLIHRDVKPGNILVTPDGIAKVSDVGLAGFARELADDPRAGKIVGTADYLSPEQIKTPLDVTSVSDIYSLGCTLYYAVCGKVPFPGGDSASKIRRHLSETPVHPRKFQPDLFDDFVDIIADMMEKNPRERTQTCSEVIARLEPWAGEVGNLTSARLIRGPWAAPSPSLDHPAEIADEGHSMESTGLSQDGGATMRTGEHLAFATAGSQASNSAIDPPPIQVANRSLSHGEHANSMASTSSPAAKNSFNAFVLVAMTIALILPPALVVGGIIGYLLRDYFVLSH
jgi:serine/threonine protein kinase